MRADPAAARCETSKTENDAAGDASHHYSCNRLADQIRGRAEPPRAARPATAGFASGCTWPRMACATGSGYVSKPPAVHGPGAAAGPIAVGSSFITEPPVAPFVRELDERERREQVRDWAVLSTILHRCRPLLRSRDLAHPSVAPRARATHSRSWFESASGEIVPGCR